MYCSALRTHHARISEVFFLGGGGGGGGGGGNSIDLFLNQYNLFIIFIYFYWLAKEWR